MVCSVALALVSVGPYGNYLMDNASPPSFSSQQLFHSHESVDEEE